MLFITIFIAITGISALTFALLYNLLPFEGRANEFPNLFLGLGFAFSAGMLVLYRLQVGRWPTFGSPDENRKTMPTNTERGSHEDKKPED